MAGGDISYTCTSTPGVWKVTLTMYRDCNGITMCAYTCGAPCNKTMTISGADPGCNGTSFGSFPVSIVSVSDVNSNPLCGIGGKSICTNQGCVTPGSYTPGVERYVYEGTVNLGTGSGIPASCCNVRLGFSESGRNAAISTGAAGQNFYLEAVMNRCLSLTPCNSSPVLMNAPFQTLCGGLSFVYSNGAVDPDHDSLSYSFTPALTGPGTSVTYNAPYSYDQPMPYYPPQSGPFPLGIQCDRNTGDIMFTALWGSSGSFVGVMAVSIKQWKNIAGTPTLIGTTTRDLQMWISNCGPNSPARLLTNPANGTQPILSYTVGAGQTLCFDVIGKDTDVVDTTYLSWGGELSLKGATFVPKYNPSLRTTTGPREDAYQFCWTPDSSCGSTIPWYFSATAQDKRCPNTGRYTRSFAITVIPVLNAYINQTRNGCYRVKASYTQGGTPQSISAVKWSISKVPNNYTLASKDSFVNVSSTPFISFSQPGRYLVKLDLAPAFGNARTFFDTIVIDTPISIQVADTGICGTGTITATFTYGATGGVSPYTYYWFNAPDTSVTRLNADTSLTSFSVTTSVTKKYVLQVRDSKGCRGYDSTVNVKFNALPVSILPASARICAGSGYALDAGNNGGKPVKYLWSTGDSTQGIFRSDSGTFIVTLTDTNNCVQKDTMALFVNQPFFANAGNDTSYCGTKTITLKGSGGQLYQWKNLATGTIISIKSATATVTVTPTTTTKYELTAYNTQSGVECAMRDTITLTVLSMPVSTLPASWRMCPGSSYVLDPGNNAGKPVIYLWSTGDTSRTITRNDSNLYIVRLTSGGCTLIDSMPLYVNKPVVAFAGNDTMICGSKPLLLKATGGTLYQWRNITTNQVISAKSATANVTVTPTTNTNYEATAYVTQSGLECNSRDTVSVKLNSLPVSVLPTSSRICNGASYTLDPGNNGGKPVTYAWSTGANSQTISRSDSGLYIVVLTDSAGCRVADSLMLYVNKINANAGSDVNACAAQTVTLHASGGQNYSWKNLLTNTVISTKSPNPDATVTVSATSAFEATVYATQSGLECSKADTMIVSITPQLSTPVISGPASVVAGQSNSFTVTTPSANTYNWTVSNGTIGRGNGTNTISVVFASVGTGTLKVVETNSGACKSDTAQKTVTVTQPTGLTESVALKNLLVYPNPTTGLLNIELESAENTIALEVTDMLGRSVLKSSNAHQGSIFRKSLDLSAFHAGVYFVKVSAGKQQSVVKVSLK